MTDVRLTALNPADSQVYPVACNDKGEILLDPPDPITDLDVPGNLTVGPGPGATISSFGSATFEQDLKVNDGGYGGKGLFVGNPALQGSFTYRSTGDTEIASGPGKDVVIAESLGGDDILRLKDNGSATFTGELNAGGSWTDPNLNFAARLGGASPFKFRGDLSSGSIVDFHNGGAAFSDVVASIKYDGSATFSGDVTVGSRGKEWMIVESGGLAHLIEQAAYDAADEPELLAADYPVLRNIPAELDQLQALVLALKDEVQRVEEKLRMAPSAGWEVWDGSEL